MDATHRKKFTVILDFDREPDTSDRHLKEAIRLAIQKIVDEDQLTDADDRAVFVDFRVVRG